MDRPQPLDDNAATRILRALSLRPGANAAQLVRLVHRSRNAVDHALYELVRDQQVVDGGDGRDHSYFLPGSGAGPHHRLHAAELRFLEVVLRLDGATGADLAGELELSRSEISRLGTALGEKNLVVPIRRGRDVLYVPSYS